MHPYHGYYGHRCGRATSRLFWFIVGAGTATWWHAHKAHQGWYEARHCGRDRIPQNAYPAPGALGPSGPMQGQEHQQQQQPAPGTIDKWDRWGWGQWGRGSWPGQENNSNGPWDRWGWHRHGQRPEGSWGPPSPMPAASEKAPEKDVVQQATDTVSLHRPLGYRA